MRELSDAEPLTRHLPLVFLAVLVPMLGLSLMALDSQGSIDIDEPLQINTTVRWTHEEVVARAEIRILSEGLLEVQDTDIVFDGDYVFEAGITVEPGGGLIVGRDGARCTFQRGPGNFSYFMRAFPGTMIDLGNLTIIEASRSTNLLSPWQWGVCFDSECTRMTNCEFIRAFLGVGLEGASRAIIENCTFIDCQRGILARQCDDVQIMNCTFEDCGDGVEYDSLVSFHARSLLVKGCEFRGCHFGINDNAWKASVSDCRFLDCVQAVYSNYGDLLTLEDIYIEGSERGLRLNGVKAAMLSRIRIVESDIGLVAAEDCGVFLSGGEIARCRIAIQGYEYRNENGAALNISDTMIESCTYGVQTQVLDPIGNPMELVALKRVTFTDTGTAVDIDGCAQITLWACKVDASRIAMDFSNCTSIDLHDNILIANAMTLSTEAVGSAEFVNDTFGVGTLAVYINASTFVLFDPAYVPLDPAMSLDNESTVLSTMAAEALRLAFNDNASRYVWVRGLAVDVLLSSTGLPAVGCALAMTDASNEQMLHWLVGFSGETDVGWVWLAISDSNGTTSLDPHKLALRYSSLSEEHLVNLSAESHRMVRITIRLDDVAPSVTITSPVDGAMLLDREVHFKGHAYDGSNRSVKVELTWDGNTPEELQSEWDFSVGLAPGWHRLVARAIDWVGNSAAAEVWFKVIDTGVSLTIETPKNGTLNRLETIEVRGRIAGAGWVTIDSFWAVVGEDGSFSMNINLQEGTNRIVLEYGTEVVLGIEVIIVERDSTAPVISIEPVPSVTNSTDIRISGTVNDAHIPSSILVNGQVTALLEHGFFSRTLSLGEGVHPILVQAEDIAGNEAFAKVETRVDLKLELALASELPAKTGDPLLLLQLVTEPGANLTVYLNGKRVADAHVEGTTFSVPIELPEVRAYAFRVEGVDGAGNRGELSGNITRVATPTVGESDTILYYIALAVCGLLLIAVLLVSTTQKRLKRQ